MKSIQQLHESADKERQKAEDLRKQAAKQHLKAQENMDNPDISLQASKDAQKYEEKAATFDQSAAALVQEATSLEAKALEINRKKNEVQAASQAQITQLEQEEKILRGDARGMF